jgi:membrane protein DedA with SNARE-associated domain
LSGLPWYWVFVMAFLATYIENIFPPWPGDSVIIFTGSLVALDVVGFFPLLMVATIGSTLGFGTMYYLGLKFDTTIIESGRFRWISTKSIRKVERWFATYGYWLIIINRFLAGTRAVIAFFAGMSKINFKISILLSFVSALLWNTIIIYLGKIGGDNWEIINEYISLKSKSRKVERSCKGERLFARKQSYHSASRLR